MVSVREDQETNIMIGYAGYSIHYHNDILSLLSRIIRLRLNRDFRVEICTFCWFFGGNWMRSSHEKSNRRMRSALAIR